MKRWGYLITAICPMASCCAAWAAESAQDIVERSISRLGIQAEMPGAVAKMPGWLDWLKFNLSADTLRILLWGAVILGVAVTIWSLRDSLPVFSRSRRITAHEAEAHAPDPSSRMDEARLEADELADQGQYGEAMHVLLLKGLAEIRLRLGTSFAASLTSREILHRVSLPQAGGSALRAIVQSVEQTYFGGRPADREAYLGCREEFEALKRSLAASPA